MGHRKNGDAWSSETALRNVAQYVLLPGWFVPGLLDWWWHRRSQIERTSGTREAAIHALLTAELGVPILAALFLEIDAGVLALMGASVVAHELTTIWDVAYATPRRATTPIEQHTHSFLEVLPFAAFGFVAALHPQQARALFGAGPTAPDVRIRWKRRPLSRGYTASILAAVSAFIIAPRIEEFVRCWRVQPSFARTPAPAESPLHEQQTWVHESGAEGFET